MDAEGFEEWYRGAYSRVFAAVMVICGDRAAAADATDEAFVRALERWPRVRAMSAPVGWTVVVARNAARGTARRAARERALVPRHGLSSEPDVDPSLWDAVRALPKRERELVALRYVAALPERDIASALGIAAGTVARGLHDARRRLHDALTPEEDPR